MKMTPLNRIAYVQLSPQSKSYAMHCAREDLGIGDHVEAEMYAGSERAYFIQGLITDITFERWNCRCRVVNHVDEVDYSIDDSNGFAWVRHVDLTKRQNKPLEQRRREKAQYLASLPASAQDEMKAIYEAVEGEDGEDAYLGDGMWIRPDGSLEDRG